VAAKAGLPFLSVLIDIGAAVSFFSCVLACINAGARVLFFMARHGVFFEGISKTHKRHSTPHVAVGISSVLVLLPVLFLSLRGAGDFDIYGWIGTLATIAFILVYLAILVAAPLYLRRRGELKSWHVVSAVLGAVFLINGLSGNFYPAPPAPLNWISWLAIALVVAGGAWYWALRKLSPSVTGNIGQDLTAIKERYESGAGI